MRRDLEDVPARDKVRIAKAIGRLRVDPFPPRGKKLEGTDYRRIRVGDYRVVYSVNQAELVIFIIRIGHRREVYRNL